MKHLDKALIGAGAALLLSGGIAAAALGPSSLGSTVVSSLPGNVTDALAHRGGPFGGMHVLATAATYIGITEDALRTELQAGKSLAEVAVANGKTRDGLVAALAQAATTEIGALVDSKNAFPGPMAGGRGDRGMHLAVGGDLGVAATYLGIGEADLRTKLQAGETLASIANATPGKSRDGLVQALVADHTAKIDAAQAAGRITAEQATQMKADLTTRIGQMVDSTRPAGPIAPLGPMAPGFGHGGRGR